MGNFILRVHIHTSFGHACSRAQHLAWPVTLSAVGARCSSVVRVFAHGAMGRRIDPSCGEPIELFLVPASAPRLV